MKLNLNRVNFPTPNSFILPHQLLKIHMAFQNSVLPSLSFLKRGRVVIPINIVHRRAPKNLFCVTIATAGLGY